MAGLVSAIHAVPPSTCDKKLYSTVCAIGSTLRSHVRVDARDEPGHDGGRQSHETLRSGFGIMAETKTAPEGAVSKRFEASLRRGFFGLGLFLHRPGILALGADVAVDELDHGHGG